MLFRDPQVTAVTPHGESQFVLHPAEDAAPLSCFTLKSNRHPQSESNQWSYNGE